MWSLGCDGLVTWTARIRWDVRVFGDTGPATLIAADRASAPQGGGPVVQPVARPGLSSGRCGFESRQVHAVGYSLLWVVTSRGVPSTEMHLPDQSARESGRSASSAGDAPTRSTSVARTTTTSQVMKGSVAVGRVRRRQLRAPVLRVLSRSQMATARKAPSPGYGATYAPAGAQLRVEADAMTPSPPWNSAAWPGASFTSSRNTSGRL